LSLADALVLAGQVSNSLERINQVDIVLCPPSVYIYPVYDQLQTKPRNLFLGLQNMMWEDEGAYTGETSYDMVKRICDYVIIGHSERRKYFHETDEEVNKKTAYALKNNVTPIICVGEQEMFDLETHYEREVKRMKEKDGILTQIDLALKDIPKSSLENVAIAYEPVWAIGTGNAATGSYASAIAYIIREHIKENFGVGVATEVKVLYGGSVSVDEAKEFMMQPSIDGLLVGRASLKAGEFVKICQISSEVKSGRVI